MTKPTIPIDASVYQQMTAYAEEHELSLSDLVARMWALWQQIDQAHSTLYPHQIAGEKLDGELDIFLAELADEGPRPAHRAVCGGHHHNE